MIGTVCRLSLVVALLPMASLSVPGQVPATPQPPSLTTAPAAEPTIPVQLGVRISDDTVTVGQRFIVVVRVRAPRGATIQFPEASDSATQSSTTATQIIGKPVLQPVSDSTSTTISAAYRLAAWDVGPQPLGLPDIIVRHAGQTGYVSVADRSVFVRSVLPADSALRVPKPLRPQIQIAQISWTPWLIAAAALLAALIAWRIWVWYRRRSQRPLDPFSAAQADFDRIEAMELLRAGHPEQHAAMMSDVMRNYLSARVPRIEPSHTSSELLARTGDIHASAKGLGDLLWRADLIKFANIRVAPDEAERLGATARAIVRSVESFVVERDRAQPQEKAA